MGKLTLPNGTTYETGMAAGNQQTLGSLAKAAAGKATVKSQPTLGSLAKAAAEKAAAITELAKAAQTWETRSREYGLDRDFKDYLLSKSRDARDEITRLEGNAIPEPETKLKF